MSGFYKRKFKEERVPSKYLNGPVPPEDEEEEVVEIAAPEVPPVEPEMDIDSTTEDGDLQRDEL